MTQLVQYHAARAALAASTKVEEAKSIREEMEHVKLYARQVEDRALMADATEIQMRAEKRLGELLIAAEECGQLRGRGRVREGSIKCTDAVHLTAATLDEIGISRNLSSKSRRAATISEQAFEVMVNSMRDRIRSGVAIIADPIRGAQKDMLKAERKAAHAARTYEGGKVEDLQTLIDSGFRAGAIMADPAWHFVAHSDKGEGRSASQHYDTQTLENIKALPVAELAAKDCVLFLWMVDWFVGPTLDVVKAWGFEHKTTAFTWVKLTETGQFIPDNIERSFHFGQGYWTRANPEDCWLATRGSPKRIHADVRQLLIYPVMEHSRKPDIVHARIERLVDGPYLELNARRERPGWTTWGNEVPFTMPDIAETLSPHDPVTGEVLEAAE